MNDLYRDKNVYVFMNSCGEVFVENVRSGVYVRISDKVESLICSSVGNNLILESSHGLPVINIVAKVLK